MGGCCSKDNQRAAYKTELGTTFLKSLQSKFPEDGNVIIIKLRAIKNQKEAKNYSGYSGPYVEMKLFPPDDVAGDQLQRSSFKPGEGGPKWVNSIWCASCK